MSKYYRVEDVQELITACTWRMTLAKERNGEGFVEYDKQIIDVDEFRKRLSKLPTIDVVHCEECKYAQYCEQRLAKEMFGNEVVEWWEVDFCQNGERIDND